MNVEKVAFPDSEKVTWLMLDDNYLLVTPIQDYLRYLDNLKRSPNTIHAYAGHLKLYWKFLHDLHINWLEVIFKHIIDKCEAFIAYFE